MPASALPHPAPLPAMPARPPSYPRPPRRAMPASAPGGRGGSPQFTISYHDGGLMSLSKKEKIYHDSGLPPAPATPRRLGPTIFLPPPSRRHLPSAAVVTVLTVLSERVPVYRHVLPSTSPPLWGC